MFKLIENNKSYFLLSGLLFLLVCSLNYAVTIAKCALIFSAIVTVVSLLLYKSNKHEASMVLFTVIMSSIAILYNVQYYIQGKVVDNLVVASLVSLYISTHCAISILSSTKLNLDFKNFNFSLLVVAGALDALMMSVFFSLNSHFSYTKILSVAAQEVSYKTLYALVIYGFCVLVQKSKLFSRV
jgi:hypothetical protein